MSCNILITGGAGFIGSHLADELLENGYRVRALDNLSPQVHGPGKNRPPYLNREAELIIGDVRSPVDVSRAIAGADAVYHFAAMEGVAQSLYQVREYTDVNNTGTAVLLDAIMKSRKRPKLIVASSMSVYGEGCYTGPGGITCKDMAERPAQRLRKGDWEVRDGAGNALTPVPTTEDKVPSLASISALSKYGQERMCLIFGAACGFPVVALRFSNVYGTRQALSNPYTGVLAIFASRLLNGDPPLIFEDGLQRRDFVSVNDAATACRLALERDLSDGGAVINIGSGGNHTVLKLAKEMAKVLGKEGIAPEVTGKYRVGDIRHCFADISLAGKVLGYEPGVPLETGLIELASWLEAGGGRDGRLAHG